MNYKLFILLISVPFQILFTQVDITKEDVFLNRTFSQDWVYGLNSMNDGVHYTTLEYGDTTSIKKYNYQSGKIVDIILQSIDLDLEFSGYQFNSDETLVLIETETEKIYRYSKKCIYYLYNLNSRELIKINDKKIRLAEFSPNSKFISYIYRNNIYTYNISTKKTKKITHKGLPNKIICGASDWVHEEEFGFTKAYEWSPDSRLIAYYLFDESKVPEFSMDIFENGLYPKQDRFKYPKAGERNSNVKINIINLETNINTVAKINQKQEFYFPRIKWNNNSSKLFVQRLNRHQNHLELLAVNPDNGNFNSILEEKETTYIDVHNNLTFYDDDSFFLWTSEKNGFNHIYLYRKDGKEIRQITKGNWEVTQFYGFNQKTKTLYYQSTENSPLKRDIYSINVFGKKKKLLSKNKGTNNAQFSKNYNYFINTHSSANTPNLIELYDNKGRLERIIKKSDNLNNTLKNYNLTEKEFFNFNTQQGINLNGWMMKPANFDANKKYPVLMYVYGGPGSQTVKDEWGGQYMWYQMLCQKGFIVVSIDNRGTGGRGAEFKKCTYKELGKLETIDQIEGAKYLSKLPYVDSTRIGIWGWSYGGYMSSLCILKGSQYFNSAIAVAPVTNWRFYDTIYTERYMQTPEENPDGYDLNSPIHYVDSLIGNYFIIHGSADDNVHVQNTYEMVNALVKANKQFELFIYPDKNHGIYGANTRLHLFTQITDFIVKNL
ncbi:MAG: S9 family peptidase [Flavobacteriales bacterium]|nr:S9 family peptidase [Flavobacteriales bacterium]|tara:strand:- start:18531 stop:20684 length:2154 start_codon:yes stop_codon:yes gene_type:complete